MTKSDLNSKIKMAATIMTWISRGIPLIIGQSMRKWNLLNTPIKTWIVNLSIGDEDNCCQCSSSFDHSVSIGHGSLLCSPPCDFKQYWIWPSLYLELKSKQEGQIWIRLEETVAVWPVNCFRWILCHLFPATSGTWTRHPSPLSTAMLVWYGEQPCGITPLAGSRRWSQDLNFHVASLWLDH